MSATAGEAPPTTWSVVGHDAHGRIAVREVAEDDAVVAEQTYPPEQWPAAVASAERRWVWSDTPLWYDRLLASGTRVARCHDLRLCHAILRGVGAPSPDPRWAAAGHDPARGGDAPALFDLSEGSSGVPDDIDAVTREFIRQRAVLRARVDGGRLRLLLAAESAGGLIATELRAAGLPWDAAVHDAILQESLGAPVPGSVPVRIAETGARVRAALGDESISLDSQPKLLRALHRVGVLVQSTSRWELVEQNHPVIEPLLEYKKQMRLLTANGWHWLAEWVRDGRFRPVYVPGGVVTGRWASSGGGALQIPRQLRPAVRADPGWKLVVADVAQLEPRVLAAMSSDTAMAQAARGTDLYAGIVTAGAVGTRGEAKVAMLGAMYGATTGESGRLVPRLRRVFPRAMALVDDAARTGEEGGVVSTWLGRTSAAPEEHWHQAQSRAGAVDASNDEENRARRWARDRGRFTRNFVVQGTAAEWALCWLADLRLRLAELPESAVPARASGPVFSRRAHLAFFLHDEVIVHAPAEQAEEVAQLVQASAAAAGRLLFGGFPLDFPLDVRVSESADKD